MDAVDGRRAPFPPHHYGSGGDTRDTDTQAPSSGECSPLPRPCSSDHLHSPDGSPCSAEETDKGAAQCLKCLRAFKFDFGAIKGERGEVLTIGVDGSVTWNIWAAFSP